MIAWRAKPAIVFLEKAMLLLACGVLLSFGSTLLVKQIRVALFDKGDKAPLSALGVKQTKGRLSDLQGVFQVDSVDNYTVQRDGKDAFSLFVAHYQDNNQQQHRAILFSDTKPSPEKPLDPMALRQLIWQEAAQAIKQHTAENALVLSWWDDGQRIHFLSGRDAWLKKPGQQTFVSPVWENLRDGLMLASDAEQEPLAKMARWLTMYSDAALSEMRKFFGHSRPVYLLITHDLLLRMGEMADYGGTSLSFTSKIVPAHDNLHSDIAQIKQWSQEEGDGNYLVQKEGLNYRVWITPKLSRATKNSLVARLLPFVDSLKQLPKGVQLVYQSHWGGYLSVYKVNVD